MRISNLFGIHKSSDEPFQLVDPVMDIVRCLGLGGCWRKGTPGVGARQRQSAIHAGFAWLPSVAFQP